MRKRKDEKKKKKQKENTTQQKIIKGIVKHIITRWIQKQENGHGSANLDVVGFPFGNGLIEGRPVDLSER